MTHLNILSRKAMPCHVEWITPSTHDSSIQIRVKFDCVKSVQVIAPPIRHQTASENLVQLSRTPIFARGRTHTQLVSQVLGYPLCQLERKKLQKGVVPAVGILKYLVASLVAHSQGPDMLVPLVAPICSKDLLIQQHNVQRWSAFNALASTSKI
jgi:hypothetical protein